jgi:hypothetical protein
VDEILGEERRPAPPPSTPVEDATAPGVWKAGYLTDAVGSDTNVTDAIGLDAEVDALARLIVDRDVVPPLSIGLFGDWGAGKSYFMRLLEQRVAEIASSSARLAEERRSYCADVRPISFNAWHYADDNLWASLLERIFRGLGDPSAVSRVAQRLVESGHAPPGGVLSYMGEQRRQAEAKRRGAEREKEAAEARLALLRPVAEQSGSAVRAVSAAAEATKDPALTAARARLEASYGAEAAERAGQAHEAGNAISRLLGDFRVLWSLLRSGQGARRRIALAGGFTLLILLLGLSVLAVLEPEWLKALAGAVVAVSAVVGVVARGASAAVNDEARAAAEQASTEAQQQRDAAEHAIAEADRTLDELDAGRMTGEYLLDRAAEFRSRQGLIALIREELEQLGRALPYLDGGTERVVLYIDDLDRCGTRGVVQVLEAVHLLLAFPLFVVVVGVDARWLLSSLRHHYRAQFSGGLAAATPEQYLEKIFQIPFAIQPVGPDGFERLMASMLVVPPRASTSSASTTADDHVGSDNDGPDREPDDDGDGDGAQEAAEGDEHQGVDSAAPHSEDVDDGAIGSPVEFTEDERTFASALQPIVRSPRSAKRLVNLYRLIRTWSTNVGYAEQVERDHRAILLLLALLVAAPDDAVRVFAALRTHTDATTVSGLIGDLSGSTDASDGDDALRAFQRFVEGEPALDELDAYRRWMPQVARFSFDMALRG